MLTAGAAVPRVFILIFTPGIVHAVALDRDRDLGFDGDGAGDLPLFGDGDMPLLCFGLLCDGAGDLPLFDDLPLIGDEYGERERGGVGDGSGVRGIGFCGF